MFLCTYFITCAAIFSQIIFIIENFVRISIKKTAPKINCFFMHFKKKTLASSENLEQQSFMQKILTIFWRTTKRKRLKPYFCKNCNPINHFLAFKLEKSTLQLLSKVHSPITHFALLFWSKCKKSVSKFFIFISNLWIFYTNLVLFSMQFQTI